MINHYVLLSIIIIYCYYHYHYYYSLLFFMNIIMTIIPIVKFILFVSISIGLLSAISVIFLASCTCILNQLESSIYNILAIISGNI